MHNSQGQFIQVLRFIKTSPPHLLPAPQRLPSATSHGQTPPRGGWGDLTICAYLGCGCSSVACGSWGEIRFGCRALGAWDGQAGEAERESETGLGARGARRWEGGEGWEVLCWLAGLLGRGGGGHTQVAWRVPGVGRTAPPVSRRGALVEAAVGTPAKVGHRPAAFRTVSASRPGGGAFRRSGRPPTCSRVEGSGGPGESWASWV